MNSFSKHVFGGPKQATIAGESDNLTALWELIEYLACPVNIYDDEQRLAWWGYINQVEISTGKITYSVSLDDMANRVYAYYTSPGDSNPHNTGVYEDAVSQAVYGTKSVNLSLNAASQAQAVAYCQDILRRRKYPIPKISMSSSAPGVRLSCKGWWQRLSWRYYLYTSSKTPIATTTTISNIILNTFGDVYSMVYADAPSGITGSPYRKGDRLAIDEVEELLRTGTSTPRRMLAEVDRDRRVHIYEEPAPDAYDYYITDDGEFRTRLGRVIPPYLVQPGRFARLRDVIPPSADTATLANPSKTFLEQIEWSQNGLRTLPRDVEDPFDLFKARMA